MAHHSIVQDTIYHVHHAASYTPTYMHHHPDTTLMILHSPATNLAPP